MDNTIYPEDTDSPQGSHTLTGDPNGWLLDEYDGEERLLDSRFAPSDFLLCQQNIHALDLARPIAGNSTPTIPLYEVVKDAERRSIVPGQIFWEGLHQRAQIVNTPQEERPSSSLKRASEDVEVDPRSSLFWGLEKIKPTERVESKAAAQRYTVLAPKLESNPPYRTLCRSTTSNNHSKSRYSRGAVVSRFVKEFLHQWNITIDTRLRSGFGYSDPHLSYAASPSDNLESSSSRKSSDIESTRSSPNKRRRTRSMPKYSDRQEGEESDESNQGGNPPPQSKKTKLDTQDRRRLFACPYSKLDRIRYSEKNLTERNYRGCSSCILTTIGRVKQHLYRVHRAPEHHCVRCFRVFDTQPELEIHARSHIICPVKECPFPDKFSDGQYQALRRKWNGKGDEQSWTMIWNILFPGVTSPVSPYWEPSSPDIKDEPLEQFIAYFKDQAPGILRRILSARFSTDAGAPANYTSTASLQSILKDSVDELFKQLDILQILPASPRLRADFDDLNQLIAMNNDDWLNTPYFDETATPFDFDACWTNGDSRVEVQALRNGHNYVRTGLEVAPKPLHGQENLVNEELESTWVGLG